MNLQYRIDLLVRLGDYILDNNAQWKEAKERASNENPWFIPQFVELAATNIANQFLKKNKLEEWASQYDLADSKENNDKKSVGIVMAGNVPLVGFHDFLCVFLCGHRAVIKPSSKDDVLIRHLCDQIIEWEPNTSQSIIFADRLNGCDAYIATGSNNTSGFFEYYFGKYPHIIRKNRTSVAILDGTETDNELDRLADDVYLYFGRGCRNVSKLHLPAGFDFEKLLMHLKRYDFLADHNKYRNNYEYNLALLILNKRYYMSNASILLVEEKSVFSPISQLNYEYYEDKDALKTSLGKDEQIQCIVGHGNIPFGFGQVPLVSDFADGVDTLAFVNSL